MRRRESTAWTELGYVGPDLSHLNAEAQLARQRDRRERREKRAAQAAVPVRRMEARRLFAKMHAAVDGRKS